MGDFSTPFGMTGMPGSNTGGSNISVPSPASSNTPAVGGGTNPFLPGFPGGAGTPPITSPINMAARDVSSGSSNLAGMNLAGMLGFGQGTNNPLHDITAALKKAGFSAGIAGELANFLQSGAGFNPQIAQALIDAMQPGVQRKEADIMEQFSSMGLRSGSPAAIAMGDFLGQQQLNEGQIFSQMIEQSISNYMNILLSGKGEHTSGFDQIIKWMNAASNATQSTAKMVTAMG